MTVRLADEIAAAAARWVVEDGLEYGAAKRRAAKSLGSRRASDLPSNEDLEDEVRDYIALFRADTQPAELLALRQLALRWMQAMAAFRPHLSGAVWRGTATRMSAVHIDLYCDDPKSAEIELINLAVTYDVGADGDGRDVLTVSDRCPGWPEPVSVHLTIRDHDELRGALKPDARGRTWRGNAVALSRLLTSDEQAGS